MKKSFLFLISAVLAASVAYAAPAQKATAGGGVLTKL